MPAGLGGGDRYPNLNLYATVTPDDEVNGMYCWIENCFCKLIAQRCSLTSALY